MGRKGGRLHIEIIVFSLKLEGRTNMVVATIGRGVFVFFLVNFLPWFVGGEVVTAWCRNSPSHSSSLGLGGSVDSVT